MKIAAGIAVLTLAAVSVARAEESVAECIDEARHASVSSRRTCLERSSDPQAIPAFHKLAIEVAATNRSTLVVKTEVWYLAEGAGEPAARTNDRYLREKVGSGDLMGPVWTSQRCTSRCAVPTVDVAETVSGSELRIRLRDGDDGERVTWSGRVFVAAKRRGGPEGGR